MKSRTAYIKARFVNISPISYKELDDLPNTLTDRLHQYGVPFLVSNVEICASLNQTVRKVLMESFVY